MFRNCFLALVLALTLIISAPALAQTPDGLTEAQLAELAKEPPLAQADIDLFIAISEAPDNDAQAVGKIIADSGISETRLAVLLTKLPLGMMLVSGVPENMVLTDEIPQTLRPSKDELELIKKNIDKLGAE